VKKTVGREIRRIDQLSPSVFADTLPDHLQSDAEVGHGEQPGIAGLQFAERLPADDAVLDQLEVVFFEGLHFLPMFLVKRRGLDLMLVEKNFEKGPVGIVKAKLRVHTRPEASARGAFRGEGFLELRDDLLHFFHQEAAVEIGLVVEVEVNGADREFRPPRNGSERGVMIPADAEDRFRRPQNGAPMLVAHLLP